MSSSEILTSSVESLGGGTVSRQSASAQPSKIDQTWHSGSPPVILRRGPVQPGIISGGWFEVANVGEGQQRIDGLISLFEYVAHEFLRSPLVLEVAIQLHFEGRL